MTSSRGGSKVIKPKKRTAPSRAKSALLVKTTWLNDLWSSMAGTLQSLVPNGEAKPTVDKVRESPHPCENGIIPVSVERDFEVRNLTLRERAPEAISASKKIIMAMGVEPEVRNSAGEIVAVPWYMPLPEEVKQKPQHALKQQNVPVVNQQKASVEVASGSGPVERPSSPVTGKSAGKRKAQPSNLLERSLHKKSLAQKLVNSDPKAAIVPLSGKDVNLPIVAKKSADEKLKQAADNKIRASADDKTRTPVDEKIKKSGDDKTSKAVDNKTNRSSSPQLRRKRKFGQYTNKSAGNKEAAQQLQPKNGVKPSVLASRPAIKQFRYPSLAEVKQKGLPANKLIPVEPASSDDDAGKQRRRSRIVVNKDGEQQEPEIFEPSPPRQRRMPPIDAVLSRGFRDLRVAGPEPPVPRSHAWFPWTKLALEHKALDPAFAFCQMGAPAFGSGNPSDPLFWAPHLPATLAAHFVHSAPLVEQTPLRSITFRVFRPETSITNPSTSMFRTEDAEMGTWSRVVRVVLPPVLDGHSINGDVPHSDWIVFELSNAQHFAKGGVKDGEPWYLLIAFPTSIIAPIDLSAAERAAAKSQGTNLKHAGNGLRRVEFRPQSYARVPLVFGIGRDITPVATWAKSFAVQKAGLEISVDEAETGCWI